MDEPTTAGWTDAQIRGKSTEELDSMVRQAKMALDSLEETVAQQQKHLDGLRRIRSRRDDLGGLH